MHQVQLPFTREPDTRIDRQPPVRDEKPKRKISEARRAYLRRYYEANKEKAREYQRRYNLMHKKKIRMAGKQAGRGGLREAVRETFNASDIMQSPTEKSAWMLKLILNGERYFTM